jgi:hypothetical protein
LRFFPVLILTFLAFALTARLCFALILTALVAIVLSIPAGLLTQLLAQTAAAIFGNEFDSAAKIALAGKIQQFPLPQPKFSST